MFTSCKSSENQVDSSQHNESTGQSESSRSHGEISASDSNNEDSETLWVVTNVGFENEQFGGEEDLRHVIEYYGGLPSGIDVNLEVLPMEGADLHSRLTRIRTEIMAGKGPDVFLMMPSLLPDREMLFPIPKATMERHVFLPLDELRDSSEHIEWDKINPQILSAGQGSEGQMLLPMYYSLDMGVSGEAVDLPATWENAISGNTPVLSQAYGSAFHFGRFRNLAFTDVANYEKETMTITEEELGQRMKEACFQQAAGNPWLVGGKAQVTNFTLCLQRLHVLPHPAGGQGLVQILVGVDAVQVSEVCVVRAQGFKIPGYLLFDLAQVLRPTVFAIAVHRAEVHLREHLLPPPCEGFCKSVERRLIGRSQIKKIDAAVNGGADDFHCLVHLLGQAAAAQADDADLFFPVG